MTGMPLLGMCGFRDGDEKGENVDFTGVLPDMALLGTQVRSQYHYSALVGVYLVQ